jgi:RNA polymerase sigma-70 factor (ECF subfamily)
LDKKETTVATCAVSATATNAIPAKEATKRHAYECSLIELAQRGDEQAFATLFQLHKKRVYSVCLLMTKDMAEAEDLTQEAFLQVFRSVGSFRCDSAFSTWLYRIAVNTVLMKLRRRKTSPVSLDEPVSSESPSLRLEIGRTDLRLLARSTGLRCAAPCRNYPRGAEGFSPFTRLKDINIMKLPGCWTAQSAIQNRNCTKRR